MRTAVRDVRNARLTSRFAGPVPEVSQGGMPIKPKLKLETQT